MKFHPDKNPATNPPRNRFQRGDEAYDVLSARRRNMFTNQFGHAGFQPGGPGAGGNRFSGGFGGFSGAGNFDPRQQGEPFQDMFSDFFGRVFRRPIRRAPARGRPWISPRIPRRGPCATP